MQGRKKVQKSRGKTLKGHRTMQVFESADMRQETRPHNARSALFKQHQRTKMMFFNIVTVRVINPIFVHRLCSPYSLR